MAEDSGKSPRRRHSESNSAGRSPRWGQTPWRIDFRPASHRLPRKVDFAIAGGGFTGLTAAAWLRRLSPESSVAVFEAGSIGAGSSGRTGGIVLGETAAGDLPGLGDVLAGYAKILRTLEVNCDLSLGGAYELAHRPGLAETPLSWSDSGNLRVAKEIAGGSVNPGKVVSGLARTAQRLGARIFENARVENILDGERVRLLVRGIEVSAGGALVATNALSLELNGLAGRAQPKFTLALATEPLTQGQIGALGLASRKPFYTVDLPYLWGRILPSNRVVFGSGLVHVKDWRELEALDIAKGEPEELLASLMGRVRGLHPGLRSVKFSHRWGGPMLVGENWTPVFARHPRHEHVLVLGAYSGHGVALSVYLGCWAAEALLGRRDVPQWD
jgi:glycine/D-amino acid oxidase-like deaminating enzyme